MYPVRLAGARAVLREFTPEDADDALHVVADDQVTTWLSFDSKSREGTAAMIAGAIKRSQQEPRTEYYLVVALPDDDRLIGFARIGLGGVRAGKLGYAIRADKWQRGYGTDAVRTLINFAFSELGLHRLSAAIGPDNFRSITLIDKLGFVCEGRIRDHVHTNGAWRDSLLYSVLAPEWPARDRNPSAF